MITNPNEPAQALELHRLDKDGFVKAHQMVSYLGLTKREYFAALALQGFASSDRGSVHEMAEAAVMLADALILELNEGKK